MSRHRARNLMTDEDYEDAKNADCYRDDEDYDNDDENGIIVGELYKVKWPQDGKYYEAEIQSIDYAKNTVRILWTEFDKVEDVPTANVLLEETAEVEKSEKFPWNLDKNLHSTIIGKGGENIKRIQALSQTRITIPRKEDAGQIIYIEGKPSAIELAKQEIKKLLKEEELKAARDSKGTLRSNEKAQALYPTLQTQQMKVIEVDLPKYLHGRVIGTKGSTLLEIRTEGSKDISSGDKSADLGSMLEQIRIDVPRASDSSSHIVITAPAHKADKTLDVLLTKLTELGIRGEVQGIYYPRGNDTDEAVPVSKKNLKKLPDASGPPVPKDVLKQKEEEERKQQLLREEEENIALEKKREQEKKQREQVTLQTVEQADGGAINHEVMGKRERRRRD